MESVKSKGEKSSCIDCGSTRPVEVSVVTAFPDPGNIGQPARTKRASTARHRHGHATHYFAILSRHQFLCDGLFQQDEPTPQAAHTSIEGALAGQPRKQAAQVHDPGAVGTSDGPAAPASFLFHLGDVVSALVRLLQNAQLVLSGEPSARWARDHFGGQYTRCPSGMRLLRWHPFAGFSRQMYDAKLCCPVKVI